PPLECCVVVCRVGVSWWSWRLLRVARFRLPTHPPVAWRGWLGFQDENRLRRGPSLGEWPGVDAGVRVGGGVRWCALSSAGHLRQSGTCREVQRRRLGLVVSWSSPLD